jgi:hypothetical protein
MKKLKTEHGDIQIKVSRFRYYDEENKKYKTTTLFNNAIGLKNNETIILDVKKLF